MVGVEAGGRFIEDEELGVEAWELKDLQQLIYDGKMTDGKTVAAIMSYAAKYHKNYAMMRRGFFAGPDPSVRRVIAGIV